MPPPTPQPLPRQEWREPVLWLDLDAEALFVTQWCVLVARGRGCHARSQWREQRGHEGGGQQRWQGPPGQPLACCCHHPRHIVVFARCPARVPARCGYEALTQQLPMRISADRVAPEALGTYEVVEDGLQLVVVATLELLDRPSAELLLRLAHVLPQWAAIRQGALRHRLCCS